MKGHQAASLVLTALLSMMTGTNNTTRADSMNIAPPTDAEILKLFRIHHDDFVTLQRLVTEDLRAHQMSVFNQSTIAKLTSAERIVTYRKLLSIWPGLTVGANYDGSVRFILVTKGEAIGPGWSKGVQFFPSGARTIGTEKSSLDTPARDPGVYLRMIESEWWLFYQVDN